MFAHVFAEPFQVIVIFLMARISIYSFTQLKPPYWTSTMCQARYQWTASPTCVVSVATWKQGRNGVGISCRATSDHSPEGSLLPLSSTDPAVRWQLHSVGRPAPGVGREGQASWRPDHATNPGHCHFPAVSWARYFNPLGLFPFL